MVSAADEYSQSVEEGRIGGRNGVRSHADGRAACEPWGVGKTMCERRKGQGVQKSGQRGRVRLARLEQRSEHLSIYVYGQHAGNIWESKVVRPTVPDGLLSELQP